MFLERKDMTSDHRNQVFICSTFTPSIVTLNTTKGGKVLIK
tara:strand:- start:49 stop:171 length:123 start_codon:yes stop_codon:yes gene_type:complete